MKSIFKRSSQGFTLIELLVVIAIIAILATIIIASLGTARQRARDTRASSEISQMRAQAEIFAGKQIPPSYEGVCDAGKTEEGLSDLLLSVEQNLGTTPDCNDSDLSWAAGAPLGNEVYFCADSTGYAGPAALLGDNDEVCTPK